MEKHLKAGDKFFVVSDHAAVIPLVVESVADKGDLLRVNSLIDQIAPSDSAVGFHEDLYSSFYQNKGTFSCSRPIYLSYDEARDVAADQLKENIGFKQKEVLALKAKLDALMSSSPN